jgi:soluble lytic murein transglycosylase-like protein
VRTRRGFAILATAVTAVACVQGGVEGPARRLEILGRAFDLRSSDPALARRLFEEAGEGTVLERTRLEAWYSSLEQTAAEADSWRRYLGARPPADLRLAASMALSRALAEEGELAAAAAVLEKVPAVGRVEADELLVTFADGPWRQRAAERLAVRAPRRLRRAAPELEEASLSTLSIDGWLQRSAAWRAAGEAGIAAAELRRLRWPPDHERSRLFELSRAETASGNPRRALSALPSRSTDDVVLQLLRGEAFRSQGWQRMPRSQAAASFRSCLEAARRSIAVAQDDDPLLPEALRLVVECGTEAASLDEALAAWWRLEASGWRHEQRDWLGRRLGVALAQRGGSERAVLQLAAALPRHARCLRFWVALASGAGRDQLRPLTEDAFADLYGLWARQLLGIAEPARPEIGQPLAPAEPPPSVRWLIDRGALDEAGREWRWIRATRGSARAEGLAACEFALQRNRTHEAIRCLLSVFPELGTVELATLPVNVLRAYLPLRWDAELRAAANEVGIEPWLVAGVARQESLFGAHARSPRGAIGVLQLIPTTASGHGRALGLGSRPDLYDPEVNLRIGARELARLIRRFGAVEPALAAYNAGEARTLRWWRRWPDRRRFAEAVPIPETYNYIRRVNYLAEAYRLVYDDVWRRPP